MTVRVRNGVDNGAVTLPLSLSLPCPWFSVAEVLCPPAGPYRGRTDPRPSSDRALDAVAGSGPAGGRR